MLVRGGVWAFRAAILIQLIWLSSCGGSATGELTQFEPVSSTAVVPRKSTLAGNDGRTEAAGVKEVKAASLSGAAMAVLEPSHSGYKVGPQDVLEISVFKVPELSRMVQVGEAGSISLPLIGDVKAAGRTAQAVEAEIAQKLGARYLQSPQVSVFVKEFNSQRVTIEGAVKKAGVYPLRARLTLLQLLAQCEGVDVNSASAEVIVFRNVAGRRSAARFDIDAIRGGTAEDPELASGDVVVVPQSDAKVVWNNFIKAIPIVAAFTPLL